jgi:hypothetical protein
MTEGWQRLEPSTAQDHLSHRYATGVERSAWEAGRPLERIEAVGQLGRAVAGERDNRWWNNWELPVARKVDVAAGLSLLPAIRDDLDQAELRLMLAARARGATWLQVADILGLESRQAAEQRCRRLRERWPDVTVPGALQPGADRDGEVLVPPAGHQRIDLMDPVLIAQEDGGHPEMPVSPGLRSA